MESVLRILFGPPGTGKTWQALRHAVRILEPEFFETASDDQIQTRHAELVRDSRIVWVTFHPSYSYEDFVEGYRPVGDDSGGLSYEVLDGPFKKLCTRCRGLQVDLEIGEKLQDLSGKERYEVVDREDCGWVVKVRPGRKDEVSKEQLKYVDKFTIARVAECGFPPAVFSIPGTGLVPVDKYGIAVADLPKKLSGKETRDHRVGNKLRRYVASKVGLSSSDFTNSGHYGAVYARLKEKENHALKAQPVVLVIDEINRADLSRVFGELITLLEVDKREGLPEERRVRLPYSGDTFSVPRGLSVVGTMNTADRSLSAMDYAMRRRFEFVEILPDLRLCPDLYGGVDIRALLEVLNKRLSVLRSRDHRIGHATLMEEAFEGVRIRKGWDEKEGPLRAVAYQLRKKIVPLLVEYFHEDWRRVEATLGSKSGLVEALEAEDVLDDDAMDLLGLQEADSFDLSEWWDPEAPSWDAQRFTIALQIMVGGSS